MAYLWGWYVEVSVSTPLTYTELKNWSELTHRNLNSFEVTVLMKLDYLNRTSNAGS